MNKMIKIKEVITIMVLVFLHSCDPVDENYTTFERVENTPGYAEGLLINAYTKIPTHDSYTFGWNETATDNAVCNDKTNQYSRMAIGQWTSSYNPMEQWSNCISAIQSINQFRSILDSVHWRNDVPEMHELYLRRFHGESLGLRAYFKFCLLQTIAGTDENGMMAGIPIMNKFLDTDANFNIPRSSFKESVQSIYDDISNALVYFTMDDYKNVSKNQLPAGYENFEVTNYNAVFGSRTAQRISGRILKALRAKVALLEASPAYARKNTTAWAKAANYSGELLKSINGLSGLDPEGYRFYTKENADKLNLEVGNDMKEMLWRLNTSASYNREQDNFPPTMFGNGRINPTQNLVDAFPMQNGYPINHSLSKYDPDNPYQNRDSRLREYILCNGDTYKGVIIKTGIGGKENAKDSLATSTRTGYYLKKLLVEEANPNPAAPISQKHYSVHIRYTELFLIYAEAANEAWGPEGDNGFGMTPRSVIAAIRKRAGIAQPDEYLNSIQTKDDMRKLIHNERRLELCFEGFRFWDLRRWKDKLDETANGIEINLQGAYNIVPVEQRLFEDYMYTSPIPLQETLKYDNLIQNLGW